MAIKRWNANTSQWELVGTPGTVTPSAIGAAALSGPNTFTGNQTIAGNVGIGTSSPTAKLHVNAGAEQPIMFSMNNYYYAALMANENSSSIGLSINVKDASGNIQTGYIAGVGGTNPTLSFMTPGSSNGNLVFGQNNGFGGIVERMRIDSSGNVGIGTGSPAAKLHVKSSTNQNFLAGSPVNFGSGISVSSTNDAMSQNYPMELRSGTFRITANNTDSSGGTIQFSSGGETERARLDSNGYLLVGYTSSNGAYKLQVNSQIFATSSSIATSDGRYKENVLPISSGLDIIDSLNPVSFDWKAHPVHNFVEGKTVGFIAQEVKEALKDYEWVDNLIKTNYNEELDEEFLGIAESNIIPLLVAAVKELRAEVNTLKAQLNN